MSWESEDDRQQRLDRAERTRLAHDIEQTQGAVADLIAKHATLRKELDALLTGQPTAGATLSRMVQPAALAQYYMQCTTDALLAGRAEVARAFAAALLVECEKLVATLAAGPSEPPPAFGLIPAAE